MTHQRLGLLLIAVGVLLLRDREFFAALWFYGLALGVLAGSIWPH